MYIKGQDLLACLQLCLGLDPGWTYVELAERLGLSTGGANMAVHRALDAGLLMPDPAGGTKPVPRRSAILGFLEHGVAVAFHVAPGRVTRGVPTAYSAAPLNALIQSPPSEIPLVWADPEGTVRGRSVEPLYRSVPSIARRDARMHELLALVDGIRCGATREQALARQELRTRLIDDAPR
ncbi:hypothetical protein Pla163_37730 [Planctomycetes bacterium Pla163]|uniref:Uncharacterized protein n=1 Tax=Rohdeia mirabilis TaxID=2528008 RepID=A0A518D568_9BACT|nr:hypothetical protein Pla163_37730 [Planctomycetes bacterium Pla163]